MSGRSNHDYAFGYESSSEDDAQLIAAKAPKSLGAVC